MGAACFLYSNLADRATISASSQVLALPASNLQNPHVARKWRSQANSDYVVFDYGSLVAIDTLAIIGLTGATIQARVSSADSTGAAGDLYDSGVQSIDTSFNQFVSALPAQVSGRYVRFDLTSAGSYVEAGRVTFGARTQLGINFGFGWERGRVDRSIRAKTRGGQTQVNPDTIYRTVNVTFGFASETEANGILDTIDRVNGLQTDVLFIVDPNSANLARDSYWGLIQENTPVINPTFQIFSKSYKIEERQ